jgi:hypothetical protein
LACFGRDRVCWDDRIIKIEATETRLFLVVVVFGVAFGAASLVEHLLRNYAPADLQLKGQPTDIWPRWYLQRGEPLVYHRSDQVPYSYVVLPRPMVPDWLNKRGTRPTFGSQAAQQDEAQRIASNIAKLPEFFTKGMMTH